MQDLGSAPLGYDEIQDLYVLLGIVASNDRVPENFRIEILNWALNRQKARLSSCTPDQNELIGKIILNIKSITQNFRQRLPEAFQPVYLELI